MLVLSSSYSIDLRCVVSVKTGLATGSSIGTSITLLLDFLCFLMENFEVRIVCDKVNCSGYLFLKNFLFGPKHLYMNNFEE